MIQTVILIFLFPTSIQYQADKRQEKREIPIRDLLIQNKFLHTDRIRIVWQTVRRTTIEV